MYWKSREELIDDINKNNIYIEIATGKITRCSSCASYTHTEKICCICNHPCKTFDDCDNPGVEQNKKREDLWISCCTTLNLFPYNCCNYYAFKNFCIMPCALLYCCVSGIITTTVTPIMFCCDCTYACCCVCYTCNKNFDLRKSAVKKTHPFDFRNQMVYEETEYPWLISKYAFTFTTEFKTSFGRVVLGYDKSYDSKYVEDRFAYVSSLHIDGEPIKIHDMNVRDVVHLIGRDSTAIVRQYMV